MKGASIVDGNAIAGMLAHVFDHDITMMRGRCSGCGAEMALAETRVELDTRAAIVRCRACTMTLFTLLIDGSSVRLRIGSLAEISS